MVINAGMEIRAGSKTINENIQLMNMRIMCTRINKSYLFI